jgi:hypothetical protein
MSVQDINNYSFQFRLMMTKYLISIQFIIEALPGKQRLEMDAKPNPNYNYNYKWCMPQCAAGSEHLTRETR